MRIRLLPATAMLAAAIALAPAGAQDRPADKPAEKAAPAIPDPVVSVTRHTGTFGGQRVAFTATAGETYLKAEDGTPKAAIFSVAYVREPRDPARPVTFLFNGGPGSGSLWLHMGAFGPKRVAIPGNGTDDGAPPYRLIDNPGALLDVTDIVFIDPVGTGFSRALGKTEAKDYWGVTSDAQSVAEFIRRWLSDNGRWNSPKFLGGESYGTTRTAAVVNQLEGRLNDVALNGVILISTILDFGLQAEVPGNEMAYVVNLPTYAVTALYHGKVADPPAGGVEAFAEEARRFAIGPYLQALTKGSALAGEERATIRRQLARYTGLDESYLESADLRVVPGRFFKQLLRDRGLTVGRLDSRYTGRDYDSAGENVDLDPSFYGIDASYTATVNAWIRDGLKFSPERQYVTIGGVQNWDWRINQGDSDFYFNVTPWLGKALRENSGLRVFVAQGWYDIATPFFGAEYALSRTGIPVERVTYEYYGAGHMMYIREDDLTKLSDDVRDFIRRR